MAWRGASRVARHGRGERRGGQVKRGDEAGQDRQSGVGLVGLVDDLLDVERRERQHRDGHENQQRDRARPQPHGGCERDRRDGGKRDEDGRLDVDPEGPEFALASLARARA